MTHQDSCSGAVPTRSRRRNSIPGACLGPLAACAVAGASFLIPGVALAYRTSGDLPEFSGTERVRWVDAAIPYAVHATDVPGYDYASVEAAVRTGVEGWVAPICSSHTAVSRGAITQGASGDGMVTIAWSTLDWQSLGYSADALGLTDILYQQDGTGQWHIADADILFNAVDYQWFSDSGSADTKQRSIEAAVAHEWGHALGLLHPCEPDGVGAPNCGSDPSYALTTMYPYYTGPSQAALGADDEAGVCFLYPALPCEPACAASELCVDGVCVAGCGDTVCGSGERCLDGACVAECEPDCPASCLYDADCPVSLACIAGTCMPIPLENGDPCADDAQCASGICQAGACAPYCGTACPSRYVCQAPDDPSAACLPTAGLYGEECLQGEDCVSNLCLVGATSVPQCSRECGYADSCPDGDRCQLVDGRKVCLPGSAPAGGCSIVRRNSHPDVPKQLLFLFLLSLFRLSTRRESR